MNEKPSSPPRWPLFTIFAVFLFTAIVGCHYYPGDFRPPFAPGYHGHHGHYKHAKYKHHKYKHAKHHKHKKHKRHH